MNDEGKFDDLLDRRIELQKCRCLVRKIAHPVRALILKL